MLRGMNEPTRCDTSPESVLVQVSSDSSDTRLTAWTVTDDTPSRRVFTRPLSPYELGFFYDGKFNGVADSVDNYLVVTRDESLFRLENISRAWVAIKQLFPLLGATTKELESQTPSALFVVSELDLGIARPNDITLGMVQSEEQVHSIVDRLISGPRQLSDESHARLYIYSRSDKPGHFHAIFLHSHVIIDGTSALTMIRTFFDILSLPPYGTVPDLQTRLALCAGIPNLNPNMHLPRGQRCWRQAAGHIIRQSRFQKLKVGLRLGTSGQLAHLRRSQGGISLPRADTTHTGINAAASRRAIVSFSRERSSLVVASCRKHSITIGSALPVLSQMGSTRVLHRRYLRGEISEKEWMQRLTQPFHSAGPINLRPFLDQEWYENGGAEVVMLGINFYIITIPSMPTVPSEWLSQHRSELEDGAPPFSALFPRDRFVRRVQWVKKQFKHTLTHPLIFEIATAPSLERAIGAKAAAERWTKLQAGEELEGTEQPIHVSPTLGYVFHNGGSSLGNVSQTSSTARHLSSQLLLQVDPSRPTEYPLSFDNPLSSRKYYTGFEKAPPEIPPTPTIEIVNSWKKLSVRPGELYLGAETKDQKLSISVSWDGNAFSNDLVEEWLDEIRQATEYYLC